MHILFSGGGTAGHINPALAAAQTVKAKHPDAKISYIGTSGRLEAKLVPQAGYDFYKIDVQGFQRSLSPKNIAKNVAAVYKAVKSSSDAKKLLKRLRPDLVVGTGGYVSGPVLRAAQKLGIKTAIHEQNAFPGVTTKMLANGADAVMLAMPEAEKLMKLSKKPIITGNPVRSEFLNITKEEAREKLGLDSRPMIFSFGGSLGAAPINRAVADLMAAHWKSGKYYHFHGAGSGGYKAMKELVASKGVDLGKADNIRLSEYINDMAICMAAADLLICRAGAITLSELQILGKAAVLIPSPYVAENHQYHNTMTLVNQGAAEVIEEKDLSGETLANQVLGLIDLPELLGEMGKKAGKTAVRDTNERIYNVLMSLIK